MPKDDATVAAAARRLVEALASLDQEGGDHALLVDRRRQELEAAVRAEGDES